MSKKLTDIYVFDPGVGDAVSLHVDQYKVLRIGTKSITVLVNGRTTVIKEAFNRRWSTNGKEMRAIIKEYCERRMKKLAEQVAMLNGFLEGGSCRVYVVDHEPFKMNGPIKV